MFKQLKYYYFIVILPFLCLLVGSAIFINAIMLTLTRNPHPQINYAIFVIILGGGVFVLVNARRLVREARDLVEFSEALHAKKDAAALQEMANQYTGDIACLLQMVATSSGRSISHQEQAAIEHELNNTRDRLNRRNSLPQYLTGLLVGMGLLGTFIGLLSTLADISALIGSFAELDMKNASPIEVFRVMIERMKAPMRSMGIAFSASMFGLLGSIILGLMMVGIRRLQGDIYALMGAEVARHIETALAYEGVAVAGGPSRTGDEYKVLVRIEERVAEAARQQQRALAAEVADFRQQRADMARALAEQTESNDRFRSELQEIGRQLGAVVNVMQKGNGEIFSQFSEMTVNLSGGARDSHKLLSLMVEEQKALRDTLDSYRIEERLNESARQQQRAFAAELEDYQKQRADMLRLLAEQNESNNRFRSELQELGRQLAVVSTAMNKGNEELCNQIAELMVHMTADAKESHKLLRETLGKG